MTPAERKAVAKTLREWARWCEANPAYGWAMAWSMTKRKIGVRHLRSLNTAPHETACAFCEGPYVSDYHRGPTAATGLLLAAAMVEAGDSL
jgi:hypothetical protein